MFVAKKFELLYQFLPSQQADFFKIWENTVGQMSRQKFENDVLVPTLVADGFLQDALAVGDLQDQLTQQKTS